VRVFASAFAKKNLFSQTNGWQEEEPKVGPSQIVEKSREPRPGVFRGGGI